MRLVSASAAVLCQLIILTEYTYIYLYVIILENCHRLSWLTFGLNFCRILYLSYKIRILLQKGGLTKDPSMPGSLVLYLTTFFLHWNSCGIRGTMPCEGVYVEKGWTTETLASAFGWKHELFNLFLWGKVDSGFELWISSCIESLSESFYKTDAFYVSIFQTIKSKTLQRTDEVYF